MTVLPWLARFVAGGLAVAAPVWAASLSASTPAPTKPAAAQRHPVTDVPEGGCNIAIWVGLAVAPLVVLAGLHADPDVHFALPDQARAVVTALIRMCGFGHFG